MQASATVGIHNIAVFSAINTLAGFLCGIIKGKKLSVIQDPTFFRTSFLNLKLLYREPSGI